MDRVPDDIISAHMIHCLNENAFLAFRLVCKRFYRLSATWFPYAWKRRVYARDLLDNTPKSPLLMNDEESWTLFKTHAKKNIIMDIWESAYASSGLQKCFYSRPKECYPDVDLCTRKIIMPDPKYLWEIHRIQNAEAVLNVGGFEYLRFTKVVTPPKIEEYSTYYPIRRKHRGSIVKAITKEGMRDALERSYHKRISKISEKIQATPLRMYLKKKIN